MLPVLVSEFLRAEGLHEGLEEFPGEIELFAPDACCIRGVFFRGTHFVDVVHGVGDQALGPVEPQRARKWGRGW